MAHNSFSSFASWVFTPSVTYDNTSQGSWNTTYYTYPKEITSKLDDYFSKFWEEQGKPLVGDNAKLPKTNAYETKRGMTLECFIPFATKEDINITLDPSMNIVRIHVEPHQSEEEASQVHLQEISRTTMKRTFMLDKRFDISKAEGDFSDGILTIKVPYAKGSEKKTLTLK